MVEEIDASCEQGRIRYLEISIIICRIFNLSGQASFKYETELSMLNSYL